MCTHSRVDYNKQGFMDVRVWKKLIDDIAASGKKYNKLLPFGLGESLLHPRIYEILEYLFERNKKRELFGVIILHTNALLMDKKISDLMLKYQYQIGAIHFSLDAATEEIYAKVRPGGNLKLAVRNIVYFLKHRSQIPPRLVFQFIVMKRNFHEARKFLDFWAKILKQHNLEYQVNYDWVPEMIRDTIFFKRENTWKPEWLKDAEQLHKQVAYELGLIKKMPKGRILKSDEFIE